MKKFIALILGVMMLASCFVISASADGFTCTQQTSYTVPEGLAPLDINMVSMSNNYNNSSSSAADWQRMFVPFMSSHQSAAQIAAHDGYTTDFEVIGQFNSFAKLDSIVFYYTSRWGQRMNNISVSLSKDNETWTTLGNTVAAQDKGYYLVITLPEDVKNAGYQYIKLSKSGGGWLGFNSCMIMASENFPENAKRINTTYTEGYCNNAALVWNEYNATTVADKPTASNISYSEAKFDNPTVVSRISFTNAENGGRARSGKIYLSVDGENWDTVVSMPGSMSNFTTYTWACVTNKAYQYIRVESSDFGAKYNWSALRVNVYGWAETDTRAEVLSVDSSSNVNVWNDANTTVHNGAAEDGIIEYTAATFKYPTVVNDIYFTNGGSSDRNRMMLFYGYDGNEWTQIYEVYRAKNSGFNHSTQHFVINDETPYVAVKAVQNLGDYEWDAKNIAVYGEPVTTAAVYGGAQAKIDSVAGTYAVRFLATIDEAALANYRIGFEIVATYEGGSQEFDLKTSTAYSKVAAGGEEFAAADLYGGAGHEYICAVALKGVSIEKYDDVTFTVRVYTIAEKGAERLYGAEYTVVLNDGVEVK